MSTTSCAWVRSASRGVLRLLEEVVRLEAPHVGAGQPERGEVLEPGVAAGAEVGGYMELGGNASRNMPEC